MRGPAYRIVTPRLVVRCYEPSDVRLLDATIRESIEHLRPSMDWITGEPLSEDARLALLREFRAKFDRSEDFVFGIFDARETQVLGGTGLHYRVGPGGVEIGYWLGARHEGQGYVTEAAGALTRVAFEVYERAFVEIRCAPANIRSAAVPRRLGFAHEATLKKRVLDRRGELRDTMIWGLVRENYGLSAAARQPYEAFDAAGRRLTEPER